MLMFYWHGQLVWSHLLKHMAAGPAPPETATAPAAPSCSFVRAAHGELLWTSSPFWRTSGVLWVCSASAHPVWLQLTHPSRALVYYVLWSLLTVWMICRVNNSAHEITVHPSGSSALFLLTFLHEMPLKGPAKEPQVWRGWKGRTRSLDIHYHAPYTLLRSSILFQLSLRGSQSY